MKWNLKRKRFLDRRSRKLGKRTKKGHKSYTRTHTNSNPGISSNARSNNFHEMIAPRVFSIFANHEEVTQYLLSIFNLVHEGTSDLRIYMDFQPVQKVSVECIVYTIAIIKNVRTRTNIKREFMGSFPDDLVARKLFEESGFLKYVKSNSVKNPITTDRIQIQTGRDTGNKVASEVCDFAKATGLLSAIELRVL